LATFALAINSRSPTAAINAHIAGRTLPTIVSANGRTTGTRSRVPLGRTTASSRRVSAVSSPAACSMVTPGRSLPSRSISCRAASPNGPVAENDRVGRHISTPMG
jgi:hypothetical protein